MASPNDEKSDTSTTATPTLDRLTRHPLQKLASPSRGVSAAVHLLGLASFGSSYAYLIQHPNEINSAWGWHFQYLTIIGLTLATITFAAGLAADLSADLSQSASTRLFAAKNMLSVAAAPLEVLVSLLYWGLRAVDPALVVPPDLELPRSTDLGFHLSPALFLLVDLLLLSPPWTTVTATPALGLATTIALLYWAWIEICFAHNGFYPYPLFALLPTYPHRVALFAGSAVVMAANTLALKWLHTKVNRLRVAEPSQG